MRKILLLGILLLTTSLSAFSSPEQLDSLRSQLNLQEVEVWGERATTAGGSLELPMVSEITRDEIVTMPVQSVADILKYSAHVDVRTRGASGAQADVSLRGGTFDQVIILLNGVNLTDAQTGHYSLNLPVSIDLIDRIEIRDNSINIITNSPPKVEYNNSSPKVGEVVNRPEGYETISQASLRLTAGMNALVNPAATFRLTREDWYLNTSAEYTRLDGYYAPAPSSKEQKALDNSDLKLANIFLQTGYKGLDIQLGAQYKDAGAGMFYGFGSQDQFDATRTGFAAARYARTWGRWGLDAAASYRANYDRYEWHRGQRLYGNFHFAQNTAASVKGSFASRIGKTTLGLDLRNENIHSTNLGDTINPDGQVPNVPDFPLSDVRVLDLVKGKNRLNLNYFVDQTFTWKSLSAGLLLNGNWNTMFGNNYSGSANISYHYGSGSFVFLTANRSLRMPTFTDLYYDAGNQLGNPNLQPEEAWTLTLGTKYETSFSQSDLFYLNADAYYRWGRNIIDWVYTPEDTKRPYHAQNHNQVDAAGMEATIAYKRDRWLRNIEVSYAYTWLDLDVNKTGSRYLDYLSHKLVARLEHDIWRFSSPSSLNHQPSSLGASWTLTWQKREGQFNTAEGQVADYQPVLLLDAQLFWQNPYVKVAVDCTNITNRHYYDYGGILQPGAWAKLTISAKLSTLARTLH